MKYFRLLLPVLSCLLLAAHFSRANNDWLAAGCVLFPLVLFSKKTWVMRLMQWFLVFGAVIWIERTIFLVRLRMQLNQSWLRLMIILGVVALFTGLSALVFNHPKIKAMFKKGAPGTTVPAVFAAFLTTGLLCIVQWKVKNPVPLLADRFLPGAGWLEVFLLALYAGWVAEKLMDPAHTAKVRTRIWSMFSLVFFTQFLLGLAGIEKFLMTGQLHLPVPVLIIAGPLFRGEGFFMLILFAATVLLVGPAWCSYLCYIGAWDHWAAGNQKKPSSMPGGRNIARIGIFILVVLIAVALRLSGIPGGTAAWLGVVFGLLGVGIMVVVSRKKGVMAHCITYCPIGLVADWLGKVSPFRLKITETCNGCGACRSACRYEALEPADIEKRKPGLTCTLCGDCITRCNENSLQYSLPGANPRIARAAFIVMAAALHALFLGVARL